MPYRVYGVYGNFEVRFSFLIRQWVDHFNAHKTAHPLATDMDIVGGLYIVKALVLRQFRAETICRHGLLRIVLAPALIRLILGDSLHGIKTFKVEARRSDKTFPMTSPELMRELGAYLLGRHNYLRVDVKNPQFKVIVEIRDYGAYIHGPKIQGEGGLPVGTSGRALNMLSGGIDSPVAAYRMAKRGLGLDHIHFASPPYTSERAKLKVKALAQLITPYTGSTNLFVVPYTKPQEYIRDNAPDVLFTVLMRRSMMRIANIIARKQGCEALVTGESLAQVASQTVKALQCTDAAQDLPILRPLIGMDKTEIVETARHINTFETSILPYEDCCTIFTPPHPKIRPELSEILEAEAGMPGLAELEAEAAEATERIRLRITDDVEFEG